MNEPSLEKRAVIVEREIPHPPEKFGARLPNRTSSKTG